MASPPTIAVDLRALVPEAAGIGVYTRSLLDVLAAPGRPGGFRYLGLSQRAVRGGDELAAGGVSLEVQPAPLGVLWQQTRLPARLAAGDVDLLWSPLATLPWRPPVPSVVTVHDLTALLFPEAHTARVRWSMLPFLARSLATARQVVAISQATAADVAVHFPEVRDRLRVVPNGVDRRYRPAGADEVAAIRAGLGAPDGYLLAVGTLEPRKNLGTLLTAWEALAAADRAFPPLVLVGGAGWETRSFRRRLAELERRGLRHLGRVDDDRLLALYQGATAFAYPSLYEGFGLPVLEAMACGVPVVTSDVSSLPEIAGDAALLVDPRDASALARALRRLIDEPALAADLAARGRIRAAEFSWERTAAAMEDVFREALA
ncbi:MAG TPA: glycosyltransferase family 1 protein [Thermoanaerobaculia bacterium]|nr:glycosyltransferase family 1 protein [Thermoanaerobaculia bacterium]